MGWNPSEAEIKDWSQEDLASQLDFGSKRRQFEA